MKRIIGCLAVALLLVSTARAEGFSFGVGASFGPTFPIIQEDQGSGTSFGLHARIPLVSFITLEPNIGFVSFGEPDAIDGVDLGVTGSSITHFGVNGILGSVVGKRGVSPFLHWGFGSFKVENDDTGYEETELGWLGGIGVLIGFSPQIGLDIRGNAIVAPQSAGSKKAVSVTGGLTYNFGSF